MVRGYEPAPTIREFAAQWSLSAATVAVLDTLVRPLFSYCR